MPSTEYVTLPVDDGSSMRAFVARPSGRGPHRAILVFQDAMGVNESLREIAADFAAKGFVALAPELFHRFAPGFETDALDMKTLMPLIRQLTVERMVADNHAAHRWLTAKGDDDQKRIAAMGFCMGGRATYLANSELPLAAAVSYYGGGIAPALLDRAPRLSGAHMFIWAGKDRGIPPEQHRAVVDAVREAGKRFVDVEFSGVDHAFFQKTTDRYDPWAATQSWAMTLAFLDANVPA
ncbi:MAG: dienelactone hydrolase family protein [Gemmatimonadaceae bacterium]|nr:dienelactone hydrolase family protein [Gemmatimonadaceae bacterium]